MTLTEMTEMFEEVSDYMIFRGRCREMSEVAIAQDPTLTLVRGYYHCPLWGKQAHWWTKRSDGSIYDPTVRQFPIPGAGTYEEFTGTLSCEECGKDVHEDDAVTYGNYGFCSGECVCRFVGVTS